MGMGAFTLSTCGIEHGSCSTVHGLGFRDNTDEEVIERNPASHQESRVT